MTILRNSLASLSLTSLELVRGGAPSVIGDDWVPFPVEPPRRDLDIVF